MTDENRSSGENNTEEPSFAELFEAYDDKISKELNQGDMVEGQIISIGSSRIYVDTGTKSDGVVEKTELLDESGELPFQVGDVVKLYVVSVTESEVILSKALSGAGKSMMLKEAWQAGTPVEGKVSGVVKGGFSVDLMGKRAFCPVSQMDVRYVEETDIFVGQVLHFLITRYEEGGKNIVISRRQLLEEEIKASRKVFFETHEIGDTLQGTVSRMMPFGAFVELQPGIEGMVHVSELSWSRVEKPEEIVQPGETVMVRILRIEAGKDPENPKIALSIRQTSDNPWDLVSSSYNVGDQLTGKVVRLAGFGAFVEIAPGVDGLVHVSEMSHVRRVLKPENEVQVGESVQVVIKSIDPDGKRISLSMKDALGDPWTGASARYPAGKVISARVEKRESFGLFINLEPGVTGLLPASNIKEAADASVYDRLKPGDSVQVMIQAVDEDARRISLASPEQKEGNDWQQFAGKQGSASFGSMGSLLAEALKKGK